ncbi:2-succinylbenzoate--CoA ligase [Sporomusa sphaeroides DSM 2875]|uniref:Sulfoacetate--CoA ligase n=2 Tax=Sporomusa TaxID=2375 RepID=A0ABM9W6K9_9FIRM|nr:putative sulfoacetate--CoA ligase [Sporomusa sphaeroides DSM 2875]CVK20510.1 putative sulfoacetate--CoA ligase [Sporomusa sphaeroides DSM 2875]
MLTVIPAGRLLRSIPYRGENMSFETLAQLLTYRALHDSERIFISVPEQGKDLTYGAFYLAAQKLAQQLTRQGLQKGGRAALILENGANWVIAFWGVLLAGGVVVPLNPRFTPAEISGLLDQAKTQLIIANHEGANALPPDLLPGSNSWQQTSIDGNEEIYITVLEQPRRAVVHESQPSSADEALLLFTSGSTGVPKGVVLSHGNLLAEAGYIGQGHQLTAADIVLCILPFFHINGLVITMITPVFTGGRAVIPHKFSAGRFWELVNQYQVTWFSAVPTILSILLSKAETITARTTSLRFARSASSSLPVAILQEFEKRYGVPVIEAYGLSEAGSQVATNPLPPGVRKAGSVGLPVGNKIQVVDELGNPVAAGRAGEVILQGANVTKGYLDNLQASRESFQNGWFYTGDLGYFDEEGYLFLTGRKKELINRAGEKISPREVDEILYQLAEIELAAAVGVPDDLFGEEIVAFVQLRPGFQLNAERVLKHCKAYLADFKIPKQILFIEDFPKGANGKIQRRRLAGLYSRLTAASAAEAGNEDAAVSQYRQKPSRKELSAIMDCQQQQIKKYKVEVDGQGCKDCGYCIEVCPCGVFTQADYFNDKGYRPVLAKASAACIGCRRCFFACPDFSISIDEQPAKEDYSEKSI